MKDQTGSKKTEAKKRDQTDPKRVRIKMAFYSNMDKALKEKKMKKRELKEKTGVSVERYRDGNGMREPSLSSAVKIADALGVSLDALCGRTAFYRDKDHLSAGECLELMAILEKNLSKGVDECGKPSPLGDTNFGRIISEWDQYMEAYAESQKHFPDKFPTPLQDERYNWIERKIEELKESDEPVLTYAEEEYSAWLDPDDEEG